MNTRSESDSIAGVPPGANGSSEHCALPPSVVERSLIEALHGLVLQVAETNHRLIVLADQNAKALEHIAFMIDLVVSIEDDDDDDEGDAASMYLDGTPLS